MSGKDNFNKDELIKSLADSTGMSVEEATAMINEDAFNKEDTDLEKSKEESKEDEYSEDTEKEMEKAMNKAKEDYDSYKSKKPKKEVQKSETNDLGGDPETQKDSELLKSMETMFGGLKESFGEKFETIEKSLNQVDELREELALVKSQLDEIGNYTPPSKMDGLTYASVIEKATDGGIQEDGKIHLSAKINKDQVGELLGELIEETQGDLQKSLEVDLSNYVSGAGVLGNTAKRIIAEKKNIIVH